MSRAVQVFINGEARAVQAGDAAEASIDVERLLTGLGFAKDRVAVELNGALVMRAERAHTLVRDGDRLEVVTLVGGG